MVGVAATTVQPRWSDVHPDDAHADPMRIFNLQLNVLKAVLGGNSKGQPANDIAAIGTDMSNAEARSSLSLSHTGASGGDIELQPFDGESSGGYVYAF